MNAKPPSVTELSGTVDVRQQLREDVLAGLSATPKSIPCKYLYDEHGSNLFEAITTVPEYYPTRAETRILELHSDEILERANPEELVEIGSGASKKTRLLLEAMHRRGVNRYAPFDVSADALENAVDALTSDYEWLEVEGFVGDFGEDLGRLPRRGRRLLAFLGSTIGNFEIGERMSFLEEARSILTEEDSFLLGVDLVKDPAVIEAAYNDAQGITAQFTTNLLHVLNRELDGDLPVEEFEHVATYSEERERMEIRLRALSPVEARLEEVDLDVNFTKGEELHAEISCKFTKESVSKSLAAAGFRLDSWHTDPQELFGLALARPA